MKINYSYDEVNIDDLTTPTKVTEHFRRMGKNIIPIVPGTKVPPKGFNLTSYFDKKCDYPITDNDSIAILHGKVSNTFAIDVDMKNGGGWREAIYIVAADLEKILAKTLVIKTPKQGCHFIVSPIGPLPPKNAKYFNKEGIEIDIKTQGGYTLLPPSIHPEKHLGRYQFISETLLTDPTDWIKFEAHIASKGFFLKEDIDDKNLSSDYDLDKLLMGKFPIGTRRRSLNSLYCKLRIRRWSEEMSIKKVEEINRKCPAPLDEKEVEYNIKYAEAYFQHQVIPTLDETKKIKPPKFNPYDAAQQLMDEYEFISHVAGEIYYFANGVYRKNGKMLISKKCRQYWEALEIDTPTINEIINIIKDKTMILSDDDNQEIFDRDYTKLILKNGMFDLATMTFGDYDNKIISTIKHPIYYDETMKCPNFDKFLDSCFDGDNIRIGQVLELMSLCFIKKYIIQKAYVNYGIGSNGKSTFLAILRNMLGIANTASIPMQQFQKSQFVGYELRGKCANISADGGIEPITKTGYLKSVLGGDAIRCEQKFRDAFDFNPFITLIFTFNELPIVLDASDGFARKIQTIHWNKKFYGPDRDPQVDKIPYDAAERSGIFNKILPIIKRLLDTRKLQHESTVNETKAVWLARSNSFMMFKNEHVVTGTSYTITPALIERAYDQFCQEERMTPIPRNILFKELKLITGESPTLTRIQGKQVRVWGGFTIASQLRDENQQAIK